MEHILPKMYLYNGWSNGVFDAPLKLSRSSIPDIVAQKRQENKTK